MHEILSNARLVRRPKLYYGKTKFHFKEEGGGWGVGRPKHNSEFGGKGSDNLEFVRRVPGYVDLGEGGRKDRNLSSESQKSIFLGIRNW